MQKVISINLNGNAFQFEEEGYDALRDYLARADRELKDNPDRAEIMADLEQAIADKCQKYLGPHKSVVTSAEATQVIAEMGPVSSGSATDGAGQAGAAGEKQDGGGASAPQPPKRLYRIPEGAMIAGVCNGIATYFQLDVTLEGESLSQREIAELLSQSDGLSLIRGQWVEIDRKKLARYTEDPKILFD